MSRYFLPVTKEIPSEAKIISHRFMIRAGMIQQNIAGIYTWLPLGAAVLDKISDIVREEQRHAGALEVLMPTIQPASLWKVSGRYDAYGEEMLRISDRHDTALLYGPTNEELITDVFRAAVKSYKELPKNLFHIQWKFRDEIRPRFGVMRAREFLMKDGYSFDLTAKEAEVSYQNMFFSYLRTFKRMGVQVIPVAAETGPIGGKMSHEFILLADTGEEEFFYDTRLLDCTVPLDDSSKKTPADYVKEFTGFYAASKAHHNKERFEKEVPARYRGQGRGIEVAHIFFFGDKYTKALHCTVRNNQGEEVPLQCGSYGIGISRLVAAVIEGNHDAQGIVWPWSLAPFKFGLVNMLPHVEEATALCDKLYSHLEKAHGSQDLLYADTSERGGVKLAVMDLIGVPYKIIVGNKTLREGHIELTCRATGKTELFSYEQLSEHIAQLFHSHAIP